MLKSFVFSSLQNNVLQQVLCLHVSNYMTQSKVFQWLNVCNGVGYNLQVTLQRIKNQSHSIHYLSLYSCCYFYFPTKKSNFCQLPSLQYVKAEMRHNIVKERSSRRRNAIQHLHQLQLLYILKILIYCIYTISAKQFSLPHK